MAACAYCGAETELYDGGVPICLECSEAQQLKRKPVASALEIRTILFQELYAATARGTEARRQFDEAMGRFPSGMPHPDGSQRIKNASNALTIARNEMTSAHNRLNDFLRRGIVPEDLKATPQKASSA
jgi:hypothetical protein